MTDGPVNARPQGEALASGEDIRSARPPKRFRGYDETSTRTLLNIAADHVDALGAENRGLRMRITELEEEKGRQEALSREKLTEAVVEAARLADWLLKEAKAEAAAIRSEAEREQALHAQRTKALAEQLEKRRAVVLGEIRTDGDTLSERLHGAMTERLHRVVHILQSTKDVGDRLTAIAFGPAVQSEAPAAEGGEPALLADITPLRRNPRSQN